MEKFVKLSLSNDRTMKLRLWFVTVFLLALTPWCYSQVYHLGDVITNPDGSKGIVFYIHPDQSGGWMVALQDASEGCPWGTSGDVPNLNNYNYNQGVTNQLLDELDGYNNTQAIRTYQNNNAGYAAGKVDFAHGWYLPSTGQLRILISKLALLETAFTSAGGTSLSRNLHYWTSTEVSASQAWYISSNSWGGFYTKGSKTDNYAVRAICNFTMTAPFNGELTYLWSTGATTQDITVSPAQTTTYSVVVSSGAGCGSTAQQTIVVNPHLSVSIVANDDAVCEGEAVTLHAEASGGGGGTYNGISIGDILCVDGSIQKPGDWPVAGKTAKGIVVYVDQTQIHGWAVGLNDLGTSKWCQQQMDVAGLTNYDNARDAIYDFNGYGNTQAIRSAGNASAFPAAWMVDFNEGWYLPAVGQWRYMYANLYTINASLQKVNGTQFPISTTWWYWSSTESTSQLKWDLDSNGYADRHNGTSFTERVRAMCSF